jgi:hypothetical protein
MGPELIFIPIAYYGSAVVGAGLLVGIIAKRSRRFALTILVLAAIAAIGGAATARPYWEIVTAGLNFTLAGLGLGVLVALWKLSSWLWGKAHGGREVAAHG